MTKAKTICVECRYCSFSEPSMAWYDYRCEHPKEERPLEQDPVSGSFKYAEKNDLGGIYFTDDKYPVCRDKNHGNCPDFEPR